jgi:hypothetical protein
LAAITNQEQARSLSEYLLSNASTENIYYLQELYYAQRAAAYLSDSAAAFRYSIGDKKVDKVLKPGEVVSVQFTPAERASLTFSGISGSVGVVSAYETPLSEVAKPDANLTVSRTYSVDGKPTTSFTDGTLVQVKLNYSLGVQASGGCYMITDYLPSGLKVISGRSNT